MASQKQLDANRKNALLSTGPKTPPGKARAKLNGLKHGLRAEQVVLPTEDPAEFQAFVDAWVADWQPTTMVRLELVEEAATAAWRKKRCLRVESQRLSKRFRKARAKVKRERSDELDDLVSQLADDPPAIRAQLISTRDGALRLAGVWEVLAEAALEPEGWSDVNEHHFMFFYAQGHWPGAHEMKDCFDISWRLLLSNDPELASDDDDEFRPYPESKLAPAAAMIRRMALAASKALQAYAAELPDDSPALARAAEAEAFASQPEDAALLRYESQLSRQFHRALGDLTKLAKSGADLVEEVAPSEANLEAEAVVGEEVASESLDDAAGLESVAEVVVEAVPAARGLARGGARVLEGSAAA